MKFNSALVDQRSTERSALTKLAAAICAAFAVIALSGCGGSNGSAEKRRLPRKKASSSRRRKRIALALSWKNSRRKPWLTPSR